MEAVCVWRGKAKKKKNIFPHCSSIICRDANFANKAERPQKLKSVVEYTSSSFRWRPSNNNKKISSLGSGIMTVAQFYTKRRQLHSKGNLHKPQMLHTHWICLPLCICPKRNDSFLHHSLNLQCYTGSLSCASTFLQNLRKWRTDESTHVNLAELHFRPLTELIPPLEVNSSEKAGTTVWSQVWVFE